jgi:superfamily II DNA/RNA helicase
MLDMGFAPQIRSIEVHCPEKEDRQTILFSATFPHSIKTLAEDFLRPGHVNVTIGRVGSTTSAIKQRIIFSSEEQKYEKLLEVLGDNQVQTLVFVKMKVTAASLCERLKEGMREGRISWELPTESGEGSEEGGEVECGEVVDGWGDPIHREPVFEEGMRVACIHGDLMQWERLQALENFKIGKVNILIATDVASRGLDIPNAKVSSLKFLFK